MRYVKRYKYSHQNSTPPKRCMHMHTKKSLLTAIKKKDKKSRPKDIFPKSPWNSPRHYIQTDNLSRRPKRNDQKSILQRTIPSFPKLVRQNKTNLSFRWRPSSSWVQIVYPWTCRLHLFDSPLHWEDDKNHMAASSLYAWSGTGTENRDDSEDWRQERGNAPFWWVEIGGVAPPGEIQVGHFEIHWHQCGIEADFGEDWIGRDDLIEKGVCRTADMDQWGKGVYYIKVGDCSGLQARVERPREGIRHRNHFAGWNDFADDAFGDREGDEVVGYDQVNLDRKVWK